MTDTTPQIRATARTVQCPACHANAGERCTARAGPARDPHRARIRTAHQEDS